MPAEEHSQAADPFTQFWSEVMSRMGMAGQPAPTVAGDAMKQMQRMFLDALAKYCDDFMRSPQFLEMMKRQMESALTFQQQVNQFLTQAQRSAQPGAQADAADLVASIRELQSRVDALQREVAGLSRAPGREKVRAAVGVAPPRAAPPRRARTGKKKRKSR